MERIINFREYFEKSADCMFYVTAQPDGRFIYGAVNPVALASTGLELSDLLGRTPEEVLGPIKGSMMTEGLRTAVATRSPYQYRPTWELPSGAVTYDATYTPHINDQGSVIGLFGVARDISRERMLETSIEHLAKMNALGELCSGVAHDFNNVLASVAACLRLLDRHVHTQAGQVLMAEGQRIVDRGIDVTRRMLTFARTKAKEPDILDPRALIENMRGMIDRALGAGISINFDAWAPAGTRIHGNRGEIELALLNLIINARDAMPQGGRITISTRQERVVGTYSDVSAGNYVVLSVSDTGGGIPPEQLTEVTKPFYTTKPEGSGTGLGLSIVIGMMKELGGGVRISSTVGLGTSVSLYFPIH